IFAAQPARNMLRYQAIDVSGDFLAAAGAEVLRVAAGMKIPPLTCRGDFMSAAHGFDPADVVLFLGTTISNFEPEAAALLLARIAADYLKPGGLLVIGQDGNQDAESLSHCYDDRRHHTAAFVMNGLRQIRRDILTNIDLSQFRYRAQFDRESRMMRMGIESKADQAYDIDGQAVDFAAGEFIQVGQSRKYTGDEVREMAAAAGYAVVKSAASPEGVNLHFFRNGWNHDRAL
ncbi:MAG TPA: L-histidine N(alpha)-methyltransferase, partial [Alphaproteobacteria bacterium]